MALKTLTENQFKKKLSNLSPEQKDELLLLLYKNNKDQLSFYFGDKTYRDSVLASYEKKLQKVFNPSERKLLTTGVDVTAASNLIKQFELIALTSNVSLSSYYKALFHLSVATASTDFLSSYGGGPEEVYDMADTSFATVCNFVSSFIGKESKEYGSGSGLEGSEDLAWDFWVDNLSALKAVITTAGACGEGLEDSMQGNFDMAESAVKSAYKEV